MKKVWAIWIAAFLLTVSAPALAQSQSQSPPPPYDGQQPEPQADPQMQDPYPADQQTPSQQPTQQQQQQDEQQQAASQPGVARVSVIQGDASTQRGDNGEWSAATVNTPLQAGDRLSTGNNSRAELQLDGLNVVRLSSNASIRVATLTHNQIQIQVDEGLVTYSTLRGSSVAVEIDTPNVAVRPRGEGQFRILVSNNAETQIVVRSGSADIATQQGSTTVTEGQMITVAGTDNPQYQIGNSPARDDWDEWNNDRNRAIYNAQSWRDTNRNYTGSEDLDGYGTWQNVPDYGPVWVPSVAPGWAPYRTGRWVYRPYYGWTWVSYEPWGWAPYHYGRWFVYGGNWAWWPGPIAAYPAYYPLWAPAYVSFFGWGGGGFGFGIGFGFGWGWGHVGWLPIGPCDWYHPWYGRWGGSVHAYGYAGLHGGVYSHDGFGPLARGGAHVYSNVGDLNSNARLREGVTSMDGRDFGRGAVPGHQEGINQATLRQASLVSGKMPIEPSKGSYSASGRSASPSTIHNASSHMFNSSLAPHNSLASNFNGSRYGSNGASQPRSDVRTQTPSANRGSYSAQGPTSGQTRGFNPPQSNGGQGGSQRGYNAGNQSYESPSTRGNWHTFTPPSTSGRTQGYASPSVNTRGYQAPPSNYNRPEQSGGYAARTPGYPQFNSPSSNQRGYSAPNQGYRGYQQPSSNRGYSSNGYRPPLNLGQPVVRPRSNGGSAPSSHGGGGRAPSSGGGYHGGGGGGSHGGGGHGGRGR